MTAAAYSVVQASPRAKMFAGAFVILYAVITILPLLWIVATAFKSQSDAIAYPPKVIFEPTLKAMSICSPYAPARRRISSPSCRRPRPGMTSSCASATW